MSRFFVEARFAPCSQTQFLAVRHGVEVVDSDGTWRESFAADAWFVGGKGAPGCWRSAAPIGMSPSCYVPRTSS